MLVGHPIKLSDLSESEIRIKNAPKQSLSDPPGQHHPDGARRQGHPVLSSDGMSWTFDANAPQVNEIQVGKALFATDRCAGKVLAVQRNGGSVSVVLGPVQLNELVKEGNFAYDQPLDLNNAIAVVAPDYPDLSGLESVATGNPEAEHDITQRRHPAQLPAFRQLLRRLQRRQ